MIYVSDSTAYLYKKQKYSSPRLGTIYVSGGGFLCVRFWKDDDMTRKRLTQIFPWLLPLRLKQRLFCFYCKMKWDKNRYAAERLHAPLSNKLFETRCPMINSHTGFALVYQENKIFNLKLAAAPLDRLVIRPGETFSFWRLVRHADKHTPYRDGLAVVNGKLIPQKGGGLCQLSNLLFWMFLHTPLTIVERHGHGVKDFPEPPSDAPLGVDATVSEGWLDLRVRNDTDIPFQITIDFDDDTIIGCVYADRDLGHDYRVTNGEPLYCREKTGIFENVDVFQQVISTATGTCESTRLLYNNKCRIGYQLPAGTKITEKGKNQMQKNIVVLFGGCSSEYGISLASASSVIQHMDKSRFMPVMVGITQTGEWYRFTGDVRKIAEDTWYNTDDCTPCTLSLNRREHRLLVFAGSVAEEYPIDAVFPVLHGKNGEDGTVQGLCELAGIPLVGCGTLAGALCMDKDRAHKLARISGVRIPASFVLEKNHSERFALESGLELGYPLFVKPVKAGSSYGITKVTEPESLFRAISEAFQYDDRVMVEACIPGFEVGCAVMGNEELTVGEIDEVELADGFFSFEEKYQLITSKIHVPARISAEKSNELKRTAKTIYKALGCRGLARVDMFLTPNGEIVFNEVNTMPGFTAHSRFPAMMQAAGLSFGQVITNAIELSLEGTEEGTA